MQRYVYNGFCTSNAGLGDWFQRSNLPLIFQSYCPAYQAVWRTCDFVGHSDERFAEYFGMPQDDALIERLDQLPTLYEFPLDSSRLWRPQFERFNCSMLTTEAVRFTIRPRPLDVRHEFNDRLHLSIAPRYNFTIEPACAVRVGVHFRAGDVFKRFDKSDGRSVPVAAMVAYIEFIRQHSALPTLFYVLTELSTANAVRLHQMLGGRAQILHASADTKWHMALASKCDVLVLGAGSFSWMLALLNKRAIKIIHSGSKYDRLPSVVRKLNQSVGLLEALVERRRQECK